jgi:hypothetical protein
MSEKVIKKVNLLLSCLNMLCIASTTVLVSMSCVKHACVVVRDTFDEQLTDGIWLNTTAKTDGSSDANAESRDRFPCSESNLTKDAPSNLKTVN